MEMLMFMATLFLLGAAHGLEPGHGKLLVTSYLTGSHAKTNDALLLGFLVAFFHTMSVGLIGTVVVLLAYTFFPNAFYNSIELISGLVILGLGILLFWRRFIMKTKHEDQCDCHLLHEKAVQTETPKRPQASFKEVVLLGLASGITPCPMALAALIAAFSLGKPLSALIALAVFSMGIGAVLMVLGIVLINGTTTLQTRFQRFKQAPVLIARVSTIVVLLLGCYLVSKPLLFPKAIKEQQAEEKMNFLVPLQSLERLSR